MWYVRPAKAQTSLRIRVASDQSLCSSLEFAMSVKLLTSFGVSKLKRRLHMLVCVYTCQNTTVLEITCHGLITSSHMLYEVHFVLYVSMNEMDLLGT